MTGPAFFVFGGLSRWEMMHLRSTFCILMQDTPGVLMRIANLIYRRNFNIVSISADDTGEPYVTRVTLVVDGDEWVLGQVKKQLSKLVEIFSIEDLTPGGRFIERCLVLVKVAATIETRPQILQIAEVFRCRVVDLGADTVVIEITGDRDKVNACVAILEPFGIIERAGSGAVAMSRSGHGAERPKARTTREMMDIDFEPEPGAELTPSGHLKYVRI